MDFKKLFLQIISVLLVVVAVVCIGTSIKRAGEPEKEYDFSEQDDSDRENWFGTEDSSEDGLTEPDTTVPDADQPVDATPQQKTVYAIASVNVRSGPGTNFEWVGHVDEGSSIIAVGEVENEWQKVIYDGQTAYIKAEYLTDEAPTGSTPAPEAAPTTPSTPAPSAPAPSTPAPSTPAPSTPVPTPEPTPEPEPEPTPEPEPAPEPETPEEPVNPEEPVDENE